MIVFVYGTTAEAIKLSAIMRLAQEKEIPFEQWVTLQQSSTVLEGVKALGLPQPDVVIANGANGKPLSTKGDTVRWLASCHNWYRKHRNALRTRLSGKKTVLVVHGDTMTSVVGALIGRGLRIPVAHVEAGLRSGSWRHPFPEELDRRIVGKLADIHYAPNQVAATALRGRANVVVTPGNTALDALTALDHSPSGNSPESKYGLILLHRFEFLSNKELLNQTVALISTNSKIPTLWVLDDHAAAYLGPVLKRVPSGKLHILSKQPHQEFTRLLANASFVVTDSGGVQEEVAFLGVPTLIHRKATERSDGLNSNVQLSHWDDKKLLAFLNDYQSIAVKPSKLDASPSTLIIDDLVRRGFGA